MKDTKGQVLYESSYEGPRVVKFVGQKVEQWLPGVEVRVGCVGRHCLMGTGLQYGTMKKFWGWMVVMVGCTTV